MSEESNSKCPVRLHANEDMNGNGNGTADNLSSAPFWDRLWGSTASSNENQCKEEVIASPISSSTVPSSLEEAAAYAQTPQVDQKFPLALDRQVSSIARGDATSTVSSVPHHQNGAPTSSRWVYPSEQQMYNAMRRKGWQNIPEESIPIVLQIHNGINELTWRKIQQWEGTTDIKLAKFLGRPRDITPKAFFLSRVLRIHDPPFDRHDWYVACPNGTQQRYVIDYYYRDAVDPSLPPIPHVDARPAFDHPRALYLHGQKLLQNTFPGFTAFWKRWQQRKEQ